MADRDLAILGIIKEIGVDDSAVNNFHTHYFRKLPLYRDEKWETYKAMGPRKLSPYGLIKGFLKSRKRHASKQIENIPTGGDLWTQGGVLVFDRHWRLRYAYDETYGRELDMDAIRAVVQAARMSKDKLTTDTSETEWCYSESAQF